MGMLEKVHYQIFGSDDLPQVVFLHGLMGSGANWRKILSQMKDYCCLVFDQRGHGRSFQPENGYAPEDYALDLKAIVDELGWEKFYLVGHSMGGRNALNFASRWPDRVKKLVIEDIGPDTSVRAVQKIEELIEGIPVPFVDRGAARQYFRSEFLQQFSDRPRVESLGLYLYSNIVEAPSGEAVWRFSKQGILQSVRQGRSQERWEELEGLQIPTLVMRGENSDELPNDVYQKMLRANPLVQGAVIPDSGHWIHADQPQLFVEALRDFLQ